MIDFLTWLFERREPIPQPVLQSYELAFKDELRRVIQRTTDPKLRQELTDMLDCPIKDRHGQCRSFTDYIVSALIKNGTADRFDLEAALAYVVEKMLMDKTDVG